MSASDSMGFPIERKIEGTERDEAAASMVRAPAPSDEDLLVQLQASDAGCPGAIVCAFLAPNAGD